MRGSWLGGLLAFHHVTATTIQVNTFLSFRRCRWGGEIYGGSCPVATTEVCESCVSQALRWREAWLKQKKTNKKNTP